MQTNFDNRLQKMLELVARGRGIEILIRIADQTKKGLKNVTESYEKMMASDIRVKNVHPPKALPSLFTDPKERKKLLLARDISDKLAHGLYREARNLINKYNYSYKLKTELNNNSLPGWRINADGHVIEDEKKIISIIDTLESSADNLIVEEFDVFIHNNYDNAAIEIVDEAWSRIHSIQGSLASQVSMLHMFRGFKRGKRTYIDENQ